MLYLIIALLVQSSICFAEETVLEKEELLKAIDDNALHNDVIVTETDEGKDAWMDMFVGPTSSIYPTSSAALMAQATFSDKSPEEQLEEIKEMANQITSLIQSEMANLLAFAIDCVDKGDKDARRKRSIETPMDSTQLVMRLLRHIKSNNEYQNIAIEKMMTAQEIADKYGIPFNPDTEILSDLAKAANEQAVEMASILKDSCDLTNSSQCQVIEACNNSSKNITQSKNTNGTFISNDVSQFEFVPLDMKDHKHHPDHMHYNYYQTMPVETQIKPPALQEHNVPVSYRPSFYDSVSYNSVPDYPYCSMDAMPFGMEYEPEPILTGEEYEETVSSKLYVEHNEPGCGTVNHVTTYTLSEKAHFKTPEIESLPQQMQYYFFLM